MRTILLAGAALVAMASVAKANLVSNGNFNDGVYLVNGPVETPVGWTPNAAWSVFTNAVYTEFSSNGITFGGNYATDQMALTQSFSDQVGILYQVAVTMALFHGGGAAVAIDGITGVSLTTDYSTPYQNWLTTGTFGNGSGVTSVAGFTTYMFDFVGSGYDSITLSGYSGFTSPTFGDVTIDPASGAHQAPAPLLAAGLPAFGLLGIGGLFGRLKKRVC